MKGVAYRRTSPGTNDEGTSLPGQRDKIESWADENDHELIDMFTDEGVSGQKTSPLERDGFFEAKEMLLRHPEAEFIVAKTKDRYGRQMRDLFSLRVLLNELHRERHGDEGDIQVLTVEDGILDYRIERGPDSDPIEQIMDFMKEMMVVFMSSYEAAQTSKKTSSSLQEKKDRSEPVGRPPFGLTTDKSKRGTDRATMYLPKDTEEDKFATAIRVLSEFDEKAGETPQTDSGPSAWRAGKDHGISSPSKTVKSIWDKRELYREVAEEHREDLDPNW